MEGKQEHPKFEVPDDPHAKHRYESALKHAEYAKAAGKSSEEIHAVFKKVMEFDPKDLDSIPKDEAHQKYRMALIHARKAADAGKSSEEVHEVFKRIMEGTGTGVCSHKK
ncbi:MAG TPA: hypothetical protein DCS74_03430 [Veillonellaceae bacterium]|jgi:fatty acid-binding protein DegV|nr:hypothetical protein [Veillonellaceae bacterium]